MRRLAAVATIVAALALPAMGQHGTSHGGFSGHAGSAPHAAAPGSFGGHAGGFAAGGGIGFRPTPGPGRFAPRGFSSGGLVRGPGPARFAPGFRPGMTRPLYRGNEFANRSRGWNGRDHDRDRDHDRRRPYYGGGFAGYPYYYPGPIFTGYVDPWLFGPDDYNNSGGYGDYGNYGGDVPAPYRDYGMQPYPAQDYGTDAYPPQAYPPQAYPPQEGYARPGPYPSPGSAYAQPRPPYQAPAASSSPRPENAVKVIFKDGRPPEEIHNYLLTSTTLTVLDSNYRQIPLDEVNLAATEAANRAAGIDFHVPPATR